MIAQVNQSFLYVMKRGEVPAERLNLGVKVAIKVAEEKDFIKGNIGLITADRIQVGKRTVLLSSVTDLRPYNELLSLVGYALAGGGAMFTGIFAVNSTINSERPILRNSQVVTGVSLIGSGLALIYLGRNTYKTEKGWYFKVIDLNENND
jgi:hypothetical protein